MQQDIRPEGQPKGKQEKGETTRIERLRTIAGLVAVALGVAAVAVIAVAAISKNSEIASTIASATGGFIATIVGAYFGVKVGSDQTKNALEGHKEEAAKAQVYAAHLHPGDAKTVIAEAQHAAETAV